MTIQEMIEVLQAAEAGKEIQWIAIRSADKGWHDLPNPKDISVWNFERFRYRVKPEPRVLWVNEYPDQFCAHPTKERAERHALLDPTARTAVKYVEVIE